MSSSDINSLSDPALRDFARDLIEKILQIGDITQKKNQGWIAFGAANSLHKAKLIASIRFSPDHIRLHAHNIDHNGELDAENTYPHVDIFDKSENIHAVMTIIQRSYSRLTE